MGRATALFLFLLGSVVSAQPPSADLDWFEKNVRPLLAENCFGCHGPKRQRAGLRVDHLSTILAGGANGAEIVRGDPDKSRLIRAIRYEDVHLRMPPKGRLPEKAIETLEEWVRRGAPWPDEPPPIAGASGDKPAFNLAQRRAAHWCWSELAKPAVPAVADRSWVRQPLDAFVLARLEARGIRPAPEADRRVLIRRLSLALLGLPPSPNEVESFVNDKGPDAYEKIVDGYLASPRFGERWGRHWLDLMRYAESYGHEFDYNIPHPWQYRDYVIRALNADVPYDQIVREHIAGDLLPEPRRNRDSGVNESLLATGFWHLHQATHAPVDVRHDEAEKIDNQIDVFAKTFLGLTVSCARCHDHKFDAISTADYYALSGYLQSSRRQIAYLDPKGSIASETKDLDAIRREGAMALATMDLAGGTEVGVRAGTEGIKLVPPNGGRVEAETLRQLALTAGKYAIQPWNGLSGNQHMFWRDARPGEKLAVGLPVAHDGRYRVELSLTKAPDYAQVHVTLNGHLLKDIDLYDPKVRSTGALDCGVHHLTKGEHRIEIEITGANKKAKRNFMVGFDWISLIPTEGAPNKLQDVAKKYGLEVDQLRRWMAAVAAPPLQRPPIQEDRVVFADAERGDFESWFRTGEAFTFDGGWYGEGDRGRVAPRSAHSGLRSRRHQGAIRSPTFTISNKHIMYRLAGEGAKIRVIIDGYMMDTYNGLLFGGVSFDVNTGGQWRWHHQHGDLGKFVGHKAYIEILDDGDGWVAIDRIVFAERGSIPRERTYDVAEPAFFRAGSADPRVRDWALRFGLLEGAEKLAAVASRWRERGGQVPRPQRALAMCDGTAEDEYVFIRGKHQNKGPAVPRRFLEALNGPARPAPRERSGRLELAEHVLASDNPLTPRVMANRIWHHLVGRGIVPTVDNFGVLGRPPSNQELLDWISATFREDDWSVKRLIRRIVLSATWRMDSRVSDPAAEEADPANVHLHRMNVVRLQGEAIRDSVLALSGRLDLKMYGRSVDQHLTAFMTGRGRPGRSGPLDGNGRRSIYIAVRRNFLDPLFLAFDGPMTHTTTGRRSVSNVPAQALALMNDPFIRQESKRWAERMVESERDRDQRLDTMYIAAFARRPSAEEREAIMGFLSEQGRARGKRDDAWHDDVATWSDLAHVLYNSKEFTFVR
ncbi:MAG: DUF1549 domain-containing protein [Planctomycetota bacterium]|nr:DUF1549 domain-containing protein [Planctomycetota bacterium]